MNPDNELLVGLSRGELDALAEGMRAPPAQSGLDELLNRNQELGLSPGEEAELDRLLTRVDHLTLLKARAQYALQRQRKAGDGARQLDLT